MQTETIVVALMVSVIAPSVLAFGNSRINSKKQATQWKRDDELEARHIVREEEVARKAQVAADVNTNRLKALEEQTNIIHSLVNHQLTLVYQHDLESLVEARGYLQKIIDVSKENNEQNQHDLDELSLKDIRIEELEKIVVARLDQQKIIDAKLSNNTVESKP